MANKSRNENRKAKHARIRGKISGTASRPRLSVFKSNKAFYAQLIDDESGKTLAASSTIELKLNGNNISNSILVGKDLAKKALDKNIKELVFDRSGYLYHGKLKAFADAIREEGVKF